MQSSINKIAVVGNQTSMINQSHLVDTLMSLGVNIIQLFTWMYWSTLKDMTKK